MKRHLMWVVLVCAGLAGCGPDYTKPGTDGELPRGVGGGERGMEYSVYSQIPATLVCGTTYKLTVGVRQQVAGCQNFNFAQMYNRTVAVANARFAELSCPEGCRPIYTWQIARRWDCQDIFGQRLAYAMIQFGILCPRETDAKPAGLAPPTAAALGSPVQEPAGYLQIQESNEVVLEEIGGTIDIPCPGSDLITFVYTEKVPSCNNLNYQPFVQQAENRALFHYNQLQCTAPCQKQPFQVLRREWSCDRAGSDHLVEVKVYFQIVCKRP